MITFGETNTKNENKQYIRKLEQIISESVKKVLNETKWIDSNDEPIDGPDYNSSDNQSQNNLPPIDRYHPDYWYYRQEEEPYDPTYDEGYLDDFSVNNDNEFKDDLNDWGIKENNLKELVKESIQQVIKELEDRIEDVPTFDVFTENVSLTELPKILESNVYDSNDNLIGKLTDLHFKYDCSINRFI